MIALTFLWHMHQPWYLDPEARYFVLPWVRLHATKDYLDMVELIREFPKIHAVVNVAPCLLEQIELYTSGTPDEHQKLCEKAAEALNPAETARLLEIVYLGRPDQMIDPYPRYYELMAKRDRKQAFSVQEIRDLQVWSNLSWMDPRWIRQNKILQTMMKKGADFTEAEKQKLLQVQKNLLNQIIPTYRKMQESGQLEISVSPWAHPILPLLFDSNTAQQTNPGMPLPTQPFRAPEDASWHLQEAIRQYQRWFGQVPRGLWPSEGSVSTEVAGIIAQTGFRWFATDEEILWKSLQRSGASAQSRGALYVPYQVASVQNLAVVFRDHVLSDLVGFTYSGWKPETATQDFLGRLKAIDDAQGQGPFPPLVVVALDGENAWESYAADGEPFLRSLYEGLSQASWIRSCTVSEYLESVPDRGRLENLAPGSWIRGEFSTWIGHPPQNRAWEELGKARQWIGPQESRALAIAEGSDWFWWLGPEHSSPDDPVFDRLFRSYLKAAYVDAKKTPPPSLEEPLKVGTQIRLTPPTRQMTLVLDGQVSSYFEWLYAGEVDLAYTGSAMARARALFSRLWWGSDGQQLYFRLDPTDAWWRETAQSQVVIQEKRFKIKLSAASGQSGQWEVQGSRLSDEKPISVQWASGKILELGLSLSSVGIAPGEMLHLTITIEQEGGILERYPEQGELQLPLPASENQHLWSA